MPRICNVCKSKDRKAIDGMLLDESISLRDITLKYGIAKSTLHNHKTRCMGAPTVPDAGERLRRENEKREKLAAPSRVAFLEAQLPSREELGDVLSNCIERIDALVTKAEADENISPALAGLDGIRKQVEALGRLAGHVGGGAGPTVNVGVAVNVSANDIASALASQLNTLQISDAATVLELTADE